MKLTKEAVLRSPTWKWFTIAVLAAMAAEAAVIAGAAMALRQLLA